MIIKSKIFEVYESEGRRRGLFTLNLTPGKRVYGEKLYSQDNLEYREWDPLKSKLASSILKGSPNIGIRKNDFVLYLGSASGTTVSHVSDIVGSEGLVFGVDISPWVMRDLIFLSYERQNIIPILADSNKINDLKQKISAVDVLYQDVAQKNQVEIFLKNVDLFLKEKGYALLALKARSIDVVENPRKLYMDAKAQLMKELIVHDMIILDPFEKDHAFFVCQKR